MAHDDTLLARRGELLKEIRIIDVELGARICKVCHGPISPERLAYSPNAVTCSPAHSQEWTAKLRRDAAKRQRERQLKARAERLPVADAIDGVSLPDAIAVASPA